VTARLRVALDATPLHGTRTGIGEFVHGAMTALAERPELDVRAYAVTWRGRHAIAGHLPAGVALAGRPVPAQAAIRLWRSADAFPIEWWGGSHDVVHGTNFVVPPSRRAATVVSVHDLTPVHFPEMCTPHTRTFPALVRRALQRGAWVHVDSAFVGAEVVDLLGADPGRVVHVPLGVPGAAALAGADPAAGHRLAGGDRYVLAMGTVEPRKSLTDLVAAFDLLGRHDPGLRLVVAGPDGWGVEALAAAIHEARYRDRIVRLGWLDDARRDAVLRGASALAYPSRYEGFGLPPLQAMAAGVPVVATDAGALVEVLGDAALLVPVGDPAALAEGLATVLADPGERVGRGLARAASFTWERCAAGLAGLYARAAAAR
jgi:glycosyltransferase involved in cell wall biosynthesis